MSQEEREIFAGTLVSELTDKDASKNFVGTLNADIDNCVNAIAPQLPPEKHKKIVTAIQNVLPKIANYDNIKFSTARSIPQCLECVAIWATLAYVCSYPATNLDVISGMFDIFRTRITIPEKVDLKSFAPLLLAPIPRPLIIDSDQISNELINKLKKAGKNINTPLKLSDITAESEETEKSETTTESTPEPPNEVSVQPETPVEPAPTPEPTPEPASEPVPEPVPVQTTAETEQPTPEPEPEPKPELTPNTKTDDTPVAPPQAVPPKIEEKPEPKILVKNEPPTKKPTVEEPPIPPTTVETAPKLSEENTPVNEPVSNGDDLDEPELTDFTELDADKPTKPQPIPQQPVRRDPIGFRLPAGFGRNINSSVWNTPVITDFGYPFLNFSSEVIRHLFKTRDHDDKRRTFNHLRKMLKEAKNQYGGIWKAMYGAPLELLKKFANDHGTLCVPNYLKVDADVLDENSDAVTVTPIKYYSVDPAYEPEVEVPRNFLVNFYDVLDYTKAFRTYVKYSDGFTPQEFLEEINDNGKSPFYILVPKQARFSRTDVTTGSLFSALFGGAKCVMLKTIFKGKRGCFLIDKKTATKLYSDIN